MFACLNVFVEADRIRRIGIDPVCSESCLTVPPTLGEASGVSAAVLPSAVAPCSCKNLRPSRGSEEVTRRGLQDVFPVAAAGLCERQGSKMSLHVHRTQRWAHLKFTAFLGLFPYASAQEQTLEYKILQPILVYLPASCKGTLLARSKTGRAAASFSLFLRKNSDVEMFLESSKKTLT